MAKKRPAQDLTLYLLKVGDRPVEEFIPKRNQLKKFPIGAHAAIGTLFVKMPRGNTRFTHIGWSTRRMACICRRSCRQTASFERF
jgi:hypothetical protein